MPPAGLESLDEFLLAEILDYVNADSPETINSASLVSRALNDATRWIKYRHLECWFERETNSARNRTQQLQEWLENPTVLRTLRYLTIRGDRRLESEEDLSVATLIEKAANIKRLDWNVWSTPPMCVLSALNHHSEAELWLSRFVRENYWLERLDEVEIALARSTKLTSLGSLCSNPGSARDFQYKVFNRILTDAPNIQHAKITREFPGYLITHGRPREVMKFNDSSGLEVTHRLRLKTLVLNGRFADVFTIMIGDSQRPFDFSSLEGFHYLVGGFRHDEFAEFCRWAERSLPNLRHLTLKINWDLTQDTLPDFLKSCRPLQSLGLVGLPSELLDSILTIHSHTLSKLQLHDWDGIRYSYLTSDASRIRHIGELCPQLSDLTIALPKAPPERYCELKKSLLLALASLKLDQLRVYMDLGRWDPEHPREESPKQIVQNIWQIVFGHAPKRRKRALDVDIGNWDLVLSSAIPEQPGLLGAREFVFWEARPHVRDDMPGQCIVRGIHVPPSQPLTKYVYLSDC